MFNICRSLENLADGFLNYSNETAIKYVPVNSDKGQYLVKAVRENQAEGDLWRPVFVNRRTRPSDAAELSGRRKHSLHRIQIC